MTTRNLARKTPIPHKVFIIITLLLICLIAGGLVLIKYQLAAIINYTVLNQFQAFGINSFDSGKPYLGLKGTGTDHLRVAGSYSGVNYQLDLSGVQAGYSLKPLFEGKLEQLFFTSIVADIKIRSDQTAPEASALELAAWLQALETLQLPVDSTEIEQLQVHIHYSGSDYQLTGKQLEIINELRQVTGELEFKSARPMFSDVSSLVIALTQPSDIPWLPQVSLKTDTENLPDFSATLNWQKQPGQSFKQQSVKAIFTLQLAIKNVHQFLTSLDFQSVKALLAAYPQTIGGNPVPMIAVQSELTGSFLVPNDVPPITDAGENDLWLSETDFKINAVNRFSLIPLPSGNPLDFNLTANVALQRVTNTWAADGMIDVAALSISSKWRGSYKPDDASQFSSDIDINDVPALLKRIAKLGWPIPGLTIVSGKAATKIELTTLPNRAKPVGSTKRTSSPQITLGFSAKNLAGLYQDVAFSEVSFDGTLKKLSTWKTSKPFNLKADSLSAGILTRNITAQLQLLNSADFKQSRWQLDSFSADLFSGEASLAKSVIFEYPFSGNSFPIALSNIRLDKVLALYKDQGVAGTGTLKGLIPVTVFKDSISVEKGQLVNTEPGKINYRSAATKSVTNQQLAMTLRLLEDFHYQSLNIDMDFEPSGKLLLSTRLSGRNPAEFDGRQVNFNINLEENLYDLFKVLKVTDQLTRELESRLKK